MWLDGVKKTLPKITVESKKGKKWEKKKRIEKGKKIARNIFFRFGEILISSLRPGLYNKQKS